MPRQLENTKNHSPECAFSWMNTSAGCRTAAT